MYQTNLALIESLEPRALLSAGTLDASHHSVHEGADNWLPLQDLVVMQDNKSVHFAQLTTGGISTIWRENPDGSLDTTFASGGSIQPDFVVREMAVQPDGKILALTSAPSLVRYKVNGTDDRAFDAKSSFAIGRITSFVPSSMALAPGGKIVLADSYLTGARVVRLNANGTLDKSFGKKGISTIKSSHKKVPSINDLAVAPTDGRIAAAGTITRGPKQRWAVFSLSPKGKLLSTFGQPTNVAGAKTSHATEIAIDRDGSIVAGGEVMFPSTDFHGILARYPARGRGAVHWHDLGIGADPFAIALQIDGKVIVGDFPLRFNYDLTQDNTFVDAIPTSRDFLVSSMALAADGSFILDGSTSFDSITEIGHFSSLRLLGDSSH